MANNPITGLTSIEQLAPTNLNCNIFSVYDYQGLTIQELLCQFFTKINEVITLSNNVYDLTEWLVNEGLEEEVARQLNIWLVDGTLANLINETIFNELNNKINILQTICVNAKDYEYLVSNNDWTIALQKAIDDASINGKPLYLPPNNYLVSNTLFIRNSGFTMYGSNCRDSKIVAGYTVGQTESNPILEIRMIDRDIAIDKVNIHDLGFDAENNINRCRGIKFDFLIYSSSFRNLDFANFTGSCFYSDGQSRDVSEMITFEQIKINPYYKTITEPIINLNRVNESLFLNCRLFSKQKDAPQIQNFPQMYLHQCQGISIISSAFFYSDNAPVIESNSTTGVNTQGLFISKNTFERNMNPITFLIHSFDGASGKAVEGLHIDMNRTNSTVYKAYLSNVRKSIITDVFLKTSLNDVVDGCTIYYNSSYGITVEDNTNNSRNSIIDLGTNFNTSSIKVDNITKETSSSLESSDNPKLKLKTKNDSGKSINIVGKTQFSDWTNALVEFDFDGTVGAKVTPRGIPFNKTDILPQPSGLYNGMILMLNENNTDTPYICIKRNGVDVWKEIQLIN